MAAILLKSRSCDAIFAAHNKTFLLVRVLQGKARLNSYKLTKMSRVLTPKSDFLKTQSINLDQSIRIEVSSSAILAGKLASAIASRAIQFQS